MQRKDHAPSVRVENGTGNSPGQLSTREEREARAFLEAEQRSLLGRRISDLGLSIHGTVVEQLVDRLYMELAEKGLEFRPPVYLSDEWGCPDGIPLIGIPFYLADARLVRIEETVAVEVEGETDIMRYLRHEAGHAFNYAYRLYDRPDWAGIFGRFSRPYREHFRVDPFSTGYVRHILGWYAQKHPDEDFAETFAVWLTPGSDWAREYAGWNALRKLEYVNRIMREVALAPPLVPPPAAGDVDVDQMHHTVGEHYLGLEHPLPIRDERHFDGDLRLIFGGAHQGLSAAEFIRRARRDIVRRVAYWTGESTVSVRSLVDHLAARAEVLGLQVPEPEAPVLVDFVAFTTAVMMNYRYTSASTQTEEAP
jgi:hypothetical protein